MFPPDSVAADDAEDDAGGRYAEQLLDHAPRRRGCCSCQNARVRLFLSFWRLFGCRMSCSHGNHNRSQCSSLNTEGDKTAPFNLQSRAVRAEGGGGVQAWQMHLLVFWSIFLFCNYKNAPMLYFDTNRGCVTHPGPPQG